MTHPSRCMAFFLAALLSGCAAQISPNSALDASSPKERLEREALSRIFMKTNAVVQMPPDHRFGSALIGAEFSATFTGQPSRCVVVELETPRGATATSVLFRYRDRDYYETVTHVSGYTVTACPRNLAGLQPFPELQTKLDALKRPAGAYCENLNGGMATPGAPWRCRYDGKKGFPTGRSF